VGRLFERDDNTWEREEILHCLELLSEFEEARKKKELSKKEDWKSKTSTPAEDKKPAKKKQSDEIRNPKVLIAVWNRNVL
jgi:hypothetical protein